MTLTLMSLLCASKSGRSCRNASRRLFAAAIVRVSGAACTDGAVRTIVLNAAKNNRLLMSKFWPVITSLLIMVMTFIIFLEIKLVLHIDSVFDEITTESRLVLEWEPVRCTSAASHCEVGVVNGQAVVVGAIEAIVDRGSEFLGQIVLLFGRGIQDPIANGDFELSRDDVFPHLHVPAPSLAEVHRRADSQRACRDGSEVERRGSAITVSHPLVAVVALSLEGPPLVLCDEIRFIGLEIVNASAEKPSILCGGHSLAV